MNDKTKSQFPGLDLGKSYWKPSGSLPIDSLNSCFRENGISMTGESKTTCCPFGFTCDDSSLPGQCKFEPRDKCQDFLTENECMNDDAHENIAISQLDGIIEEEFPGGCTNYNELYGDFCYKFVSCNCAWNSTVDECQPASNHKVGHITDSKIENWDFNNLPDDINLIRDSQSSPTTGKCVFDFTYTGSCLDGDEFIIRSWTAFYESNAASINDPEYCEDGSDVISCEKIVRLGFFSITNLIIAILALILIYYIILKKKKK